MDVTRRVDRDGYWRACQGAISTIYLRRSERQKLRIGQVWGGRTWYRHWYRRYCPKFVKKGTGPLCGRERTRSAQGCSPSRRASGIQLEPPIRHVGCTRTRSYLAASESASAPFRSRNRHSFFLRRGGVPEIPRPAQGTGSSSGGGFANFCLVE